MPYKWYVAHIMTQKNNEKYGGTRSAKVPITMEKPRWAHEGNINVSYAWAH